MYEITVHNPIETITAQLMEHFRSSFPDCSITLKMHMLEEHTVPWAKRTYVRFGLLGEQGAECIHARFNSLQRTYHSVHDPVERLSLIMKENHKTWQRSLRPKE